MNFFYGSWHLLDQATLVGEQEKSEPVDADDTAASEYQLGSQVRMASFAMDAKSNIISSNLHPHIHLVIYIYIYYNLGTFLKKCHLDSPLGCKTYGKWPPPPAKTDIHLVRF